MTENNVMNGTKKPETVIKEYHFPSVGEKCVEIDHRSGLKTYIVPKDFSEYYAIFGTKYGSVDNAFKFDGETEYTRVPAGIAHFLEHKMFENEDGTDSFEAFSAAGADANAFTSTEMTAYLFSCTDEFYTSLETLIKMVTSPYFTEETVEKEQGIIGQEIKMCEDRPSGALYYNLMKALYEKNPIRIPVAGSVGSIAKITPELLYKCYNTFYVPSNMALCLSGRIDVDKVVAVCDRLLPENGGRKVTSEPVEDVPEVFKKRISAEMEVAKPLFGIGVKFPEETKEEEAVADVMWTALCGGSSEFYSDVYESGLVTAGYSSYHEYGRAASYFEVGGQSDDPEKVYERFLYFVERARKEGIPEEDVERAKRVRYSGIMDQLDSTDSIAENMFFSHLAGENFLARPEKYASVTAEKVNELAKRVLEERRFAMSVIFPVSNGVPEERVK